MLLEQIATTSSATLVLWGQDTDGVGGTWGILPDQFTIIVSNETVV